MYAIEVRCLHALADIAALRSEINALNLASSRPDPFSTFEFYEHLLLRSGSLTGSTRSRVWFLAAFMERELIGYLALEEVSERVVWRRIKRLEFLVGYNADRPHVVTRAEHIDVVTEKFYEYLLEHRREWDFLELQQQDAASSLCRLPPGLPLKGFWIRSWPNLDNGTIRVRWTTLPEYFEALAPKFRSNLKRQMRRLLASGKVELLTSSDSASTPALLDLYCSIEERSWKSQTDLTVGRTAQRLDYVRALLDGRQPMHAVIQILVLDGVPVAGLISGSFTGPANKGLYALHIVFDEHLTAVGPGSAILMMGMRYAIEGRFTFFNLLSGFGYYKTRWLADMTATRCLQVYRIGSVLFWRRLLGDAWRWLTVRAPSSVQRRIAATRSLAIDKGHRDRPSPTLEQRERLTTTAERTAFSKLIAKAQQGKCERLSAQDLTELLSTAGHKEASSRA